MFVEALKKLITLQRQLVVVPIRDHKAITEKLELISDNKNTLEYLSNNALKKMKNQSWKNYINELDNIVKEIKN